MGNNRSRGMGDARHEDGENGNQENDGYSGSHHFSPFLFLTME